MVTKQYFQTYIVPGVSCLSTLDAVTKKTKRFSNLQTLQTLSSALAAFGTLQPQHFRLLISLVPLVLVCNYYVAIQQGQEIENLEVQYTVDHQVRSFISA